jgi:hypothetical protein
MATRRSSSAGGRSGTAKRKTGKSGRGPTRGTAPSAPDTSKLHLLKPSREAQAHEASSVDAMGQDKRREVIGHAYGPSRSSQLAVLGGVIGVALVLFFGLGAWARHSDKVPASNPDAAAWAQPDAPQTPAVRPE